MTLDQSILDEFVERVAVRVVELLGERRPSDRRMVTVAELAEVLKVSRDTIYRHSLALGAVRVGEAAKPALRFDIETACRAWTARCAGATSRQAESPAPAPRRAGRPRRTPGTGAELLPIRAQVAA